MVLLPLVEEDRELPLADELRQAVGGGDDNTTSGKSSTVGGGDGNTASGDGCSATCLVESGGA